MYYTNKAVNKSCNWVIFLIFTKIWPVDWYLKRTIFFLRQTNQIQNLHIQWYCLCQCEDVFFHFKNTFTIYTHWHSHTFTASAPPCPFLLKLPTSYHTHKYCFGAPTYLPDFYIYLRCHFVTPKIFFPLWLFPFISLSISTKPDSSSTTSLILLSLARWTPHLPLVLPRDSFIPSRVYSTAVQVRVQPHIGECSKTPTLVLFSISWMVSCIGMLKLCRMLPPNTSVSSGV